MRRAAWLLLCLLPVWLPAADKAEVLKQMDAAALKFHGLSASLTYTNFTKVVDDTTTDLGTIYFQKEKGGKGYKILIDFTQQDVKTVLVKGGKVLIARPKIRQTEEYEIGQRKELLEQFLLLGFGAGGTELAKAYVVAAAADTTLNGESCVKLDLQPKGNLTRDLKQVELWLSKSNWLPLQQKFTRPNGDTTTATYTKVKAEPQPEERFKLNDKDFKRVKPGQD